VAGLPSVAAAIAGSALYLAVLVALRAVPPELRHAFTHRGRAVPDVRT
jgi:hypothetical protein